MIVVYQIYIDGTFREATADDVNRAVRAAHEAYCDGPLSRMSAREIGTP